MPMMYAVALLVLAGLIAAFTALTDVDVQTITALTLATIAVLTYVKKVIDDQSLLARMVFVSGVEWSNPPQVEISNLSDCPIFNVGIGLYDNGELTRLARLREGESRWTGRKVGTGNRLVIPPDTRERVTLSGRGLEWQGRGWPPVFVVFCDTEGRRWTRWPDGRLARHPRRFKP